MLEGANELFGTLQSFCNGEYGMIIPLTVKGNGEVMFIREKVEGKYVQVGINIFDSSIYKYIEKNTITSGNDIEETYGDYDEVIQPYDIDDTIEYFFNGKYSSLYIASHSLQEILDQIEEEY